MTAASERGKDMATEWSAQVGPQDEDGYAVVVMLADGVEVEQHTIYALADPQGWASEEVYLRNRMETEGDCEHGLSAGLCRGPNHY